MIKWITLLILVLATTSVSATLELCEDTPEITTNCTMVTPAISCPAYNYTIYNVSGGVEESGNLTLLGGDIYYFNFTLGRGEYLILLCDGGVREVVVKPEEDKMIIGVLILLPMLLGFFLLIGALNMADQHVPLKIFMFLAGFVFFWASMHFGVTAVVEFYDFPAMEELAGTTVYWVGVTFFAIVSYFFIYAIYIMFKTAAQAKKAKLEY